MALEEKSEDLHSFYNLREHRSDRPLSFSSDWNDFDFVYDVEKLIILSPSCNMNSFWIGL